MTKQIHKTKKFVKDARKYAKSDPKSLEDLKAVIKLLESEHPLPIKNKDHNLKGNYKGYRECHVKPDMLLIYEVDDEKITLTRLGSHSELFK